MYTYKQLTYAQRCQIEVLIKRGLSQSEIGKLIGVSQSTISRELSRNRGGRGYWHNQAQQKTLERRKATHKAVKMTDALISQIEEVLRQDWSPEQVSGWLLSEHDISISHETIYRHIWKNKKDYGDLYRHLRRRAKPYQSRGANGKTSRGQIKNRISIDERPLDVELKDKVGHWEIDTVIGASHSGALVTIVERKTQFTLSMQVNQKTAEQVTQATVQLLRPYKAVVKSITADNGKEFAMHELIAKKLDCQFYFAHPYHSWERGLNENTNGLLRQYFPKCTDFRAVSQAEVRTAIGKLNSRPRKTLGFKTPQDVMVKEIMDLVA